MDLAAVVADAIIFVCYRIRTFEHLNLFCPVAVTVD